MQPKNRAPNLVLAAVATFALLGLGAGALALHRGDVAAGTKMPVAAAILAPPPPAATPARPPTERARCPEGMAFIEETTFTMGSNAADALPASKPAHAVTVSAFCIDMLEVSVAKYKACSDHGDCKRGLVTNDWPGITAAERAALEPLCNLRDPAGLADHPINCVDWERADIYCGAQGGRLPSEAEWELAASGADRRTYPWGNEVPSPSLVNACGPECAVWAANGGLEPSTPAFGATDNWLGTAPGKTFPAGATPQGVMDLAGNVSEWVADGFAPYNPTPQKDPVVSSSETRVVRGGSFVAGKRAALAATYRTREKSTRRSSSIGFRCASAPASVAGR